MYLRMQTGSRHAQSRRDGSLAACRCACCLLMFMLRHGTWAAPRLACESRHELGVSFVRRAARSTSTTAIHVSLSRGLIGETLSGFGFASPPRVATRVARLAPRSAPGPSPLPGCAGGGALAPTARAL